MPLSTFQVSGPQVCNAPMITRVGPLVLTLEVWFHRLGFLMLGRNVGKAMLRTNQNESNSDRPRPKTNDVGSMPTTFGRE
jgi:hypothetical protein